MPSITRPAIASGRVQRNGPDVACGAGLVNTSSVGMFGVMRRPRTSLTAPAPARAFGQRQMEIRAGRAQPELAQVERGQPRRALGQRLGMTAPAVRRVVGAEPREAQQVVAERATAASGVSSG